MKLYIAASSSELDRVFAWRHRALDAGLCIVSDWPEKVERLGPNPPDGPDGVAMKLAAENVFNVATADVVWLLMPAVKPGRGAFFEFGYAIALRVGVIATGPNLDESIFTTFAYCAERDEDGFAEILRRRKKYG